MRLSNIISLYKGVNSDGFSDREVSGIAYDSRRVKPGDVFVCIKGFKADGHDYASAAVGSGAVAVVSERAVAVDADNIIVDDARLALAFMSSKFYGEPSRNMKIIGVTGTNGKTTVTYLIKAILEAADCRVGLIGTNQNLIMNEPVASEYTTPESLELNELLARMYERGISHVVMEASSHSLELNRVAYCDFDVGVFTNITQDHLDFHGDMDNYKLAKSKLFNMCKTAVVNVDDEFGVDIMTNCRAVAVSYGINSVADVFAQHIELGADHVEFFCDALGKGVNIHLGMPGMYNVYNALASIGAAAVCGVSTDDMKRGLANVRGVSGRCEMVDIDADFSVMIDYAHTPDGLENILKSARGFCTGRVITVFGCGGDRDKTKREIMGQIAGELSDFCVITSDNPRTEDPMDIIDGIEQGMKSTNCEYIVIENRRAAIERAISIARENDLIIIAGKGHENYQILKDGKIPFDEKKIVKEIYERISQKTVVDNVNNEE